MAPSNVSQRVETVEQELAGIRASMEQMQAGSVQTQQTFLDEVARMNAQMRLFMEGHNRFQEEVILVTTSGFTTICKQYMSLHWFHIAVDKTITTFMK
ncbi:hypothetical protein BVRB_2g044440 [Beta vulgaris subsp. vulgaris]|uniref:Uncharacterized protein n=1 Tax=Beta vulgaris subsp. vulgaris TaxID=3555 RepID=A0A0J8E8I0_BETVV|nr:hypothetical protein BVRB_2g044440 [Beta vulgaris subsp. vulgaris]